MRAFPACLFCARRANLNPDGKRIVYSSKYALSGMVFCGHCGDIYRRLKWNNRGCKSTVWRCVSRVLKGKMDFDCPARTGKEEVLQGQSSRRSTMPMQEGTPSFLFRKRTSRKRSLMTWKRRLRRLMNSLQIFSSSWSTTPAITHWWNNWGFRWMTFEETARTSLPRQQREPTCRHE